MAAVTDLVNGGGGDVLERPSSSLAVAAVVDVAAARTCGGIGSMGCRAIGIQATADARMNGSHVATDAMLRAVGWM